MLSRKPEFAVGFALEVVRSKRAGALSLLGLRVGLAGLALDGFWRIRSSSLMSRIQFVLFGRIGAGFEFGVEPGAYRCDLRRESPVMRQ